MRSIAAVFVTCSIICCILMLSACATRNQNTWDGNPRDPDAFTVVFAPVEVQPLAEIYPAAATDFAFDLAGRIDLLKRDADGFALASLPSSGDAAWQQGRPAAVSSAGWVVLTKVTGIERQASPAGEQLLARVEMRALDQAGREVFRKTVHASGDASESPKLMAPGSRPASRAAWAACTEASTALIAALERRNEATMQPVTASIGGNSPVNGAVAITIGSNPEHADVLIDGKFRGTTPLALTLASGVEITLRLERQGYRPWQRIIVPMPDMTLAPALEPDVPAAAPAPVSVPAAVPAPEQAPAP